MGGHLQECESENLDTLEGVSRKLFRDWLEECGYENAVECCPVDRGDFLFAEDAFDLIDDFMADCELMNVDRDAVETYALEIGQVSDAFSRDPRDEESEPITLSFGRSGYASVR